MRCKISDFWKHEQKKREKSSIFAVNKNRNMEIDRQKIAKHVNLPVMQLVGSVADELYRECYVVGGYVRDIFQERPSNDMDFVTVGSGIELAKAVANRIGKRAHLAVYRNYGTAQVRTRQLNSSLSAPAANSIIARAATPSLKTGPSMMTSNAVTLPSMRWRFA